MKERIIGAIVLVVFIVLVVPVFLDGAAENPDKIVTESVALPGQNGQERKRQTIVLERDRTRPVPVPAAPAPADDDNDSDNAAPADEQAGDTAEAEPEAPAATVAAEPDDSPPPTGEEPEEDETPPAKAAPPAAPADSATGMWAVQLGSFSNKANAERLAVELRAQGYAAFLSQLDRGGRQLHRVRIGPQKDRDSAESTAARLLADGHKGQVVPHP